MRQNVRDNAALNELEWQLLSYWIPTIVSAAVLLVFMKGAVSLRALWLLWPRSLRGVVSSAHGSRAQGSEATAKEWAGIVLAQHWGRVCCMRA